MKKYILSILTSIAALAVFTSCEKDSEGLTGIVYYPAIALEGSAYINWTEGVPFTEGCKASFAGEDYTDKVEVSTQMNTSNPAPGYYTITYSVTSPDGFSASEMRYIIVAGKNDPVSGFYKVSTKSYRETPSSIIEYGDKLESAYFYVLSCGVDEYECQDMLGGYYSVRMNYGSNYSMWGKFSLAQDNSITLLDSYLPGWADSSDGLENAKWDADTKTLSWCNNYAGMKFYVTMSKVE